jgi:DNA (cytosine-5)-methyltransferase 1
MFVFENVNRFAASDEALLLHAETQAGGALEGFRLQTFTVNAADYGTPQVRRRTVIVGSRIGGVEAPKQTHARNPTLLALDGWKSVRDAFTSADLAIEVETTSLPTSTDKFFGNSIPGSFKLSQIHIGRTYLEQSIRRYEHIAPGRGRLDLPEELQYDCWKKLQARGASDVLGRLDWNKPSVTIRTEFFKPEKGRYLHPEWHKDGYQANRALTHAEAAVLQGFDDRHVWCGSKVELARQIGNAVPPPLATAIAKVVKKRFRNPNPGAS